MKPSSGDPPLVSVIIPCRNEAGCIEACVRSALAQAEPLGGFEIIVADGMSQDGTREVLRKTANSDPRLKVIDNPGKTASPGLNAAIRAAKGSIILRMDAHTEYASDYIRQCVEALQSSGADNVGGPARTKPRTYLERAIAAAYHSPFSVGGAKFHDVNYEGSVDTVTYGCWRRSAFERFGYFDEELVRNQDDEHNLRITRGGGMVWQTPKIVSRYQIRGSLQKLFKQYMQYGYWKVRVIQKHKLPASPRHLVPGAFVLFLILTGIGGFFSKAVLVLFLVTLALYLAAILIASVFTALRTQYTLFPAVLLVFPCYHFGYGCGFLRGLWDFSVRRIGARGSFQSLTR